MNEDGQKENKVFATLLKFNKAIIFTSINNTLYHCTQKLPPSNKTSSF